MANFIDTRDLIEERDELKDRIFSDYSDRFPEDEDVYSFEDIVFSDNYEEGEDEIDIFTNEWMDELNAIREINGLEEEISDFEYGITLIPEEDFEDYCQDFVEDCGYISKDFPSWIVIDWTATADNIEQDYSSVEFRGESYLFRL